MGIRDLVAVCASSLWHLCVCERETDCHIKNRPERMCTMILTAKRGHVSLSVCLCQSESVAICSSKAQKALEVQSSRKGLKRNACWIPSIKTVSMSKLLIIVWLWVYDTDDEMSTNLRQTLIHTSTEFPLKPKVLLNAYTIHVLGQIG